MTIETLYDLAAEVEEIYALASEDYDTISFIMEQINQALPSEDAEPWKLAVFCSRMQTFKVVIFVALRELESQLIRLSDAQEAAFKTWTEIQEGVK